MNHTTSVIFRALPLAMAAVCVGFGVWVWSTGDTPAAFVAGRVVTFLGAICVCLFCTAATIIRQVIGRLSPLDRTLYPALAAGVALGTLGYGIVLVAPGGPTDEFVAGHVILGLGLICGCIATVVVASREFHRIADPPAGGGEPFGPGLTRVIQAVPTALALVAWVWAVGLLITDVDDQRHFVAGHVMIGLAAICTCLIALALIILRQERGRFTEADRRRFPAVPAALGVFCIVFGVIVAALDLEPYYLAPGYVLIGLGAICLSIFAKVLLLALVWRRSVPWANRVPLIPIGAALTCLLLSSFLFHAALTDQNVVIPAHVLVGLGAICMGLFAIVSILESGTSAGAGD